MIRFNSLHYLHLERRLKFLWSNSCKLAPALCAPAIAKIKTQKLQSSIKIQKLEKNIQGKLETSLVNMKQQRAEIAKDQWKKTWYLERIGSRFLDIYGEFQPFHFHSELIFSLFKLSHERGEASDYINKELCTSTNIGDIEIRRYR